MRADKSELSMQINSFDVSTWCSFKIQLRFKW